MTFTESIQTCFTKYAEFNGRASRSEYWWFALFTGLVPSALNIINHSGMLGGLFSLAVLLPTIGVMIRRLHDTNHSGWFWLLTFVPVVGWIILLIWLIQKSDEGTNQYDVAETAPTSES